MTTEEIKEAADMAEKWPGATVLNFGELPFKALVAWVASHSRQGELLTMDFDVESVKGMFEDWWRMAFAIAHQPVDGEGRNGSGGATGCAADAQEEQ